METVNILVDTHVKEAAQELFARLGIDMSTAVNIFLRQSVYENTLSLSLPKGSKVKLGGWENKIRMDDDTFNDPIDDFAEYM